ncbi:hypothetical protein Y888_04350 [Mixta calida B021323]|nr:hypothetical protein Y888_04350 [Mixta calida B021323]
MCLFLSCCVTNASSECQSMVDNVDLKSSNAHACKDGAPA